MQTGFIPVEFLHSPSPYHGDDIWDRQSSLRNGGKWCLADFILNWGKLA